MPGRPFVKILVHVCVKRREKKDPREVVGPVLRVETGRESSLGVGLGVDAVGEVEKKRGEASLGNVVVFEQL